MKKTNTILASLALATCALTPSAFASEQSGVTLSVGHNHFIFDQNQPVADEGDFYVGFGYQFNDHWSTVVNYTSLTDARTHTFIPSEVKYLSVNGEYRMQPKGTSTWYARFGVGDYHTSPSTIDGLTVSVGLGYDFAINKRSSIVIGTDMLFANEVSDVDFVPYFGLSYLFSGSQSAVPKPVKEQPPKAPLDSDMDGVFNSADQCPNTSKGVKVNSNGCELDSDLDGVLDSKDQCANTPKGAKVDAVGCRVQLTEDVSITLKVNFANNSDVITEQYRQEIGRVAAFMRQYPDTNVVIEGHTDSRGAAAYNQQLSQRRASAVRAYLIQQFNIAPARLTAEGKGEVSPIASNETAEGRATNRRVQAEIKTTVTK